MNAKEKLDRLSELLRERNRTELAWLRAERAVATFLEVCEAGVTEVSRTPPKSLCRPTGYPELVTELVSPKPAGWYPGHD